MFKIKKAAVSFITLVIAVVLISSLTIGVTSTLSTKTREITKTEMNNTAQNYQQKTNKYINKMNNPGYVPPSGSGTGGGPSNPDDSGGSFVCYHPRSVVKYASLTYTGDVYCQDCGVLLFTGEYAKVVTYDGNGGTFETETENLVTYLSGVITIGNYKEPTRTGYSFVGWYRDSDCTQGKEFNKDNDIKTLTEDITIYAKWIPNEYTITYNTNDGGYTPADIICINDNGESRPSNVVYANTTACTVSATGTKITLDAYNGNSSLIAWKVDVTNYETLTLTASYSCSTGDGSYGFAVTPHNPSAYSSNPTWNGSAYAGKAWSGTSSGTHTIDVSSMTGTVYISIRTTAGTKHSTKVVATEFTLSSNNYGEATNATNNIVKYLGNNIIEGTYLEPTRNHYVFGGWYLDKDCQNLFNMFEITGDTTVYAKWIPESEYELFIYKDGTKISDWELIGGTDQTSCTATDTGSTIKLSAYNGCSVWVGWKVDVTNYTSLIVKSGFANEDWTGAFSFAATPSKPSYGSNLTWNGSSYNGIGSGNIAQGGTHAIDISSLTGEVWITISATAGTKDYAKLNVSQIKLI